MCEHPLFRMWKDRLEAELAKEQERTARRAAREADQATWYAAWQAYKLRRDEKLNETPLPRWWDLLGWTRWLARLHAPGGRD